MRTSRRGLCSAAPLLCIALAGCGRSGSTATARADPGAVAAAVITQRARVGDVARVITVTGSLVALHDVALSAKQGGRLAAVLVRQGDTVSAGQIVARVDDADLQRQALSDEAAIASAFAKIGQARAAYAQQVTSTTAAIRSAQAAYRQQLATSSASLRSANSSLAAAQSNLSEVLEGARYEERLQTQASVGVAEANFKKAQADLNRYSKLHDAGAVSDAELDQYKSSRDVAEANLKSARAAAELQQNGNRRQEVEQARERVRQAEESVREAEAARAQDAVKKADLDTAVAGRAQNTVKLSDVRAAEASLHQAQSALAIARQAVADAVVRSPIAGRVSARSAEPGQVVASSAVLLRVVAPDGIYFEPSVPDGEVARLRTGQPVDVEIDAYPGRAFRGSVTRIYPAGSETSRSFPIRVTVADAPGLLRPQMFATGRIETEVHRSAVLVPRAAIVRRSDSADEAAQVFTAENGIAHGHQVAVGLSSGDGTWTEIRGLPADGDVVVTGLTGLEDGARVTITPAAKAASR